MPEAAALQRLVDCRTGMRRTRMEIRRSGRMSAIAAEALVGFGYTNVWDLKGGMIAWKEAGYPIAEVSQ